jgi:peptidoglycan/xylan/chitin deacetylase (PgdA/CDA1 family)
VNDDRDAFFAATPVEVFARQMEYLAQNCNVCTLETAVEGIKRGNLPENAVVVTFDDGYQDNFVNAYPILKKYSIPATIFLATEAIGTNQLLWHDRVFSAFRATQKSFLDGVGEERGGYPLRTLDEKLVAQGKVLRFLWSMDHKQRLSWVERLLQKLGVAEEVGSSRLMLTWDEVKTMQRNGISFGSHTISHPILSRMPAATAKEEIYASKRAIEDILGSPATAFAYPVGRREDFNQSIKMMVKDAGYLCALTTIFGTNDMRQDLYELKRGNPWEADIPSFAVKLSWYKFTT